MMKLEIYSKKTSFNVLDSGVKLKRIFFNPKVQIDIISEGFNQQSEIIKRKVSGVSICESGKKVLTCCHILQLTSGVQ